VEVGSVLGVLEAECFFKQLAALPTSTLCKYPTTVSVASVSQPSPTRHNTSPKYKEHKQGENTILYLQANKTHTTSTQDQEEPQRNASVERTHLYTTTVSRQSIRKSSI
jgi:hypothetical protein